MGRGTIHWLHQIRTMAVPNSVPILQVVLRYGFTQSPAWDCRWISDYLPQCVCLTHAVCVYSAHYLAVICPACRSYTSSSASRKSLRVIKDSTHPHNSLLFKVFVNSVELAATALCVCGEAQYTDAFWVGLRHALYSSCLFIHYFFC